jgi:hypothetical protein
VHPTMTQMMEIERHAPGSTTYVSRLQLTKPRTVRDVRVAIPTAVRLHDALDSVPEQVREHDPEDPESWWTTYRLAPADRSDEIDIRLVERAGDSDGASIAAGRRPVRFECLVDDGLVREIRLLVLAAVFDRGSERRFWPDVLTALRGQEPGRTKPSFGDLCGRWHADWRSGRWTRSQDYLNERARSFDPEPLPHDPTVGIWPVAKVHWAHLGARGVGSLQAARVSMRATTFVTIAHLFGRACCDAFGWSRFDFSTPFGNRVRPECQAVVGHLANVVLMSSRPSEPRAPATLMADVLALTRHAHYPLVLHHAERADLYAFLSSRPIVAVRLFEREDGGARTAWVEDHLSSTPATGFGQRFSLLLDVFASSESVSLRVTYRSDAAGAAAVAQIADTFVEAMERHSHGS